MLKDSDVVAAKKCVAVLIDSYKKVGASLLLHLLLLLLLLLFFLLLLLLLLLSNPYFCRASGTTLEP